MDITIIETKSWTELFARITLCAQRVDALCANQCDKGLQKWLVNKEVCDLLKISMRTLQTYRDNGSLGFSKIGYIIYYRPQDIQHFINKGKIK